MPNQGLLYSFDNHIWLDLALQTNHRYDVAVKLRRVKQTRRGAQRLLLLFFILCHCYLRYVPTSSPYLNLHILFLSLSLELYSNIFSSLWYLYSCCATTVPVLLSKMCQKLSIFVLFLWLLYGQLFLCSETFIILFAFDRYQFSLPNMQ